MPPEALVKVTEILHWEMTKENCYLVRDFSNEFSRRVFLHAAIKTPIQKLAQLINTPLKTPIKEKQSCVVWFSTKQTTTPPHLPPSLILQTTSTTQQYQQPLSPFRLNFLPRHHTFLPPSSFNNVKK